MGKVLAFFIDGDPEQKLTFEVRRQVNTGRTSRDQSDVLKHVEELKKKGITLSGVDVAYHTKLSDRVTTEHEIEILRPDVTSSGEVEPAFLTAQDGQIYVTVGSDHSDRNLQTFSSQLAKQVYDNVLSPVVWRYEDVIGHWDDIILESYIMENGEEKLYQKGTLVEMLRPEVFLAGTKERMADGDLRGSVILGGTFPTLTGELNYSFYFRMVMTDPVLNRKIDHTYVGKPIEWFVAKK
jgi:hypothetical protein